jgi:predicted membrane chloride channel (bestrophin family)
MTADQRLDQLEPLVSQTLAVADRHTAQLKQLVNMMTQQMGMMTQQSENIQFVLSELVAIKEKQTVTDVKVQTMDSKLDRIIDLLSGNK